MLRTVKITRYFYLLPLFSGVIGLSFILYQSAQALEGLFNSPPEASLTLHLNDADDYAISEIGDLYSEGTDEDQHLLTFSWTVIDSPDGDPDHANEVICEITALPGQQSCIIPPLFFDADDVGSWKIRLTVSDGTSSGTAEISINVLGFAADERRPTHAESGTVEQIAAEIKYEDWNYKSLLEYTDVPGVTYWLNDKDQDLPNGNRENHYMQRELVPVLEKIAELAEKEQIDLWVTDAWDQDNGHANNSRHYEGRALDLDFPCGGCTVQKDQAGLGRLAYLAEKALNALGIENYWIWHEFTHVHISIDGLQAGPYQWGIRCEGSNCLNHQEQQSDAMSGAAVGSMMVEWLLGDAPGQETFFINAGNPARGIDCKTMAEALNVYGGIEWACSELPTREDALRTLAFWMAWTSDQVGIGIPAALALNGDYVHWVAIEGIVAEKNPLDQTTVDEPWNGIYEAGGVFLVDPSQSILSNSAKRFVDIEYVNSEYIASRIGSFEVLVATGCQSSRNSAIKSTALAFAVQSGLCGPQVWIENFQNGDLVAADSEVLVNVNAVFGASELQLTVDGTAQPLVDFNGLPPWTFRWQVPADVDPITGFREYELQAFALINGIREQSQSIVLKALGDQENPPAVDFANPKDGDDVLINQPVRVVVKAADVDAINLQIIPGDGGSGGWMTEISSGTWEYADWTPQVPDTQYLLRAVAFLPENGGTQDASIAVYARSAIDPESPRVRIVNLVHNQIIRQPLAVRVFASDNDEVQSVYLNIFGPENLNLINPRSCGVNCYDFDWNPQKNGRYSLEALAYDWAGNAGVSLIDNVEVELAGLPPRADTVHIREGVFLRTITNPRRRFTTPTGITYDTGISNANYVCGVIGFAANKGDIQEKHDWSDIIDVYTYPRNSTWYLRADFKTSTGGSKLSEMEEIWDVQLLCISTTQAEVLSPENLRPSKPIFMVRYSKLGDNVGEKQPFDTGLRFDQYVCGIVGFAARKGDINENGAGDIIQTYLYRQNGTWHIRADFRSHDTGGDSSHENWDINILCFGRSKASLDGPLPEKEYFLEEYTALGDDVRFDTEVRVSDYVCGVIGFAALDGDIDEGGSGGRPLILVYMYPQDGTWHIRGEFRTHKNRESWNVNVLCAIKDSAPPVQWNKSYEEFGIDACMGESENCQVLRDEAINLSGLVTVFGGGYSGSPSAMGKRCATYDQIEVYINDRDPSSGNARWSWPDRCLLDGESISLLQGNTYDFRGVSIVGGMTHSISLRSPSAAPVLTRAFPKLFPAPYGPGMALEWTPTLHPRAAFYEVQISEDGGATWQVYTKAREISYGGWINHHGNFKCGFGFERCLKRRQTYAYRVRVLDASKSPVTAWSNQLHAQSFEWPVHLSLAGPWPPGPYSFTEDIFMEVLDSYGQGLQLEWTFSAYNGASYSILSGCQNGSLSNPEVRTCEIRIQDGSEFVLDGSAVKLASLAPETSVDVRVTGRDSFGFSAVVKINLFFETKCDPKECEPDIGIEAHNTVEPEGVKVVE
ncbi:MAG: hypothetical protein IIC78_07945 [Chloroflexi bacterium]|nr:hypothetical protein [Chloroflexota bacterium]